MRTEKIAPPRAQTAGRDSYVGPGAWLQAELAGLAHPALWAALAVLLALFLIAPQLPLRYSFDVGREEGLGSDLPYLQGFNTAEQDELGTYRWTDDGATITVPGIGARNLLVRLDWLPTPAAALAASPQSYELAAGGVTIGALPLRPEGGSQLVVVPADAVANGSLELRIRTATFTLAGDMRSLGARLSGVEVVDLRAGGLAAPDWAAALAWLGAVALGWMVARGALRMTNAEGPTTTDLRSQPSPFVWALIAGVILVSMAALLDPPRWAFGAAPALIACALAYPLALGCRWGLPRLARRLDVPLDATSLRWLSLFIAMSFALRYGGRLYPDSMHGDIGFHHNRFNEAIWGLIAIVSVNRGVEFPYPPGPYLLVAPLTLVGLGPRALLQLAAAAADAVSAAVVYAIAARATGQRTALLAAGIYVFTAATFMTTWWSFDTHILTQLLHLLLIAGLSWALAAWQREGPAGALGSGLAVALLASLVFLGHFGFLINTALLLGLVAGAVWIASWRGAVWARRVRWPLTLAVGAAGAFAAVFFYSSYIPMFLGQIETAREGGLAAVAGRAPVSRAVMWQRLWRDGFIVHFGLFPLLLMPAGVWLLARRARGEAELGPRRALLWLILGSLAVALAFALFPFVAGVTNSPRWLMFIAWVVAVGAAVVAEALWRQGRWGRLATLAMGAFVVANTAWVWLGPMLWRIRPPEPF
ncbi:MAG: hypothetical protein HGA45_21165 [Chloroflexales bacterium]|nr:hypothetical protein [Chloroflexales bacterium]